MLGRHRLVYVEDDGVFVSGQRIAQLRLQTVAVDALVVDEVLEVLVDRDAHLLHDDLARCRAGQVDLQARGCEAAGEHKEDEQQEDDIGHRGHAEAGIDLISGLEIHALFVWFLEEFEEVDGGELHVVHDLLHAGHEEVVAQVGKDAHKEPRGGGNHGLVDTL